MELRTLSYQPGAGWSRPPDTGLDSPQTLVLAFGAAGLRDDETPLRELQARHPQSQLLGCSTAGEIFGTKVSDGGVAAAVLRLKAGQVRSAVAEVGSAAGSFAAGRRLAQELAGPQMRALLVLSDGLNVNGSELVRGINSALPLGVVVTGGLAGDGPRFERTWVLSKGKPRSGVVCAAALYGESVRVGHGSKGGWDIFGPERRVTRSEGNVLYELDGRPALELYKLYLGERAAGLPATALLFPLSVRSKSGDDKTLVRTVLSVDERAQSMTFAGDVPQGAMAQLMKANFDRLVQGASDAAEMIKLDGDLPGPHLSVAISCVGRRLVLSERIEEETEATLQALPPQTEQVGFYSYGEISPYATGNCDLHNQTMTLTLIAEN